MASKEDSSETPAERPPLGKVIFKYLQRAGMEQQDLAGKLGVTKAVVSNWCNAKRRPSRDNLWQIAGVFAQALASASGGRSTDRLDAPSILLALLHAGDYETGTEFEGYDVVFERYRRTLLPGMAPGGAILRVGWAKAPPYMMSDHDDEIEKSICGRIADRVVRALGADPRYVEVPWDKLISGLDAGNFDLIAPVLMRVPTRASQALFTNGIGILCGYRMLFPNNRRNDLIQKDEQGREVLCEDKIRVLPVKGEVGQLFCQFRARAKLLSAAEIGGDAEMESIGDAARKLLELRSDTEGVPCLITEIITCDQIEAASDTQLASFELPSDIPMWFPLAFAVHLNERRLCDLINVELRNLQDSGTLRDWLIELLPDFRKVSKRPDAIRVDPDVPRAPVGLQRWLDAGGKSPLQQIMTRFDDLSKSVESVANRVTPK